MRKEMEEIAHKFNMQRMRQKNNVTTKLTKREVPKHKPSDSKYSTLKDAMSISHKNEIDSNMNRNNKRKQKSRVVSIISNHVVVGTFTIEADKLSTAKFLVKIPAKELDDDDMLSNEVDSDFEEDLQSDEGVVRIVDVPDVMVDTSHNLYDTILHCGDDLDKFISQSKSILEGIELWFDSNNNDEEDGNSLGCSKLQKDQHAFYEVVFMGLVIMCIKYISKTNNPILLHNLVECAQVLYENVILMQNEKENGIPNKIQMANSKQLTKEEVCFRMHSNITRVDYLLKDSVNYIYIFYKDLTKDDQHLNGNGIFHDNDDLNNIEYLFDLLKNPLRQKDIRSTIYNDFLITNLISFKVYDDTFKEFKDSDSNNDEGIPSIPFLPQIKDKMGYTLVIDLDETLVHFVEENGEAFVQVRPYSEFFLSEMSKYFEIVIFTAATEDYADIVLNELDKEKVISHKLYRRHTTSINNVTIKDLSKIGRDLSKTIIIDNLDQNFSLQPQNGLHISTFMGDENDSELFELSKDLIKLVANKINDVRLHLDEVRKKMSIRYTQI